MRSLHVFYLLLNLFTSVYLAPGPIATQSSGSDGTVMMFAMGWALLALVLYFMRPTSLTQAGDSKPSGNNVSVILFHIIDYTLFFLVALFVF